MYTAIGVRIQGCLELQVPFQSLKDLPFGPLSVLVQGMQTRGDR